MRLLARIGLARDVLDDAEMLLEAVLELAPDYRAARYDYAQTLVKRQKYAQARAELERLLALDPANPTTARWRPRPRSAWARTRRRSSSIAACSPNARDRRTCICGSPTR